MLLVTTPRQDLARDVLGQPGHPSLCCLSASPFLCRPSPTCRSEVSRAGPCAQGTGVLPLPQACGLLLCTWAKGSGALLKGFPDSPQSFWPDYTMPGRFGWGLQPLLPCSALWPTSIPAPLSATELDEGLNPSVHRSLSKLCSSECFMFVCFFNCLSLQGAKAPKKGKVTRSQDISKASQYKLYQFRLTRL